MSDFAALTVVELKEECRSRGLTLGGVKKELIKRLKAFDTKAARTKAKEQQKVAAPKAAKAAHADPATSAIDASAHLPSEVTAPDKSAEPQAVTQGSVPKAEAPAEVSTVAVASEADMGAPVASEAVAPEAVVPEAKVEAAVAPEAAASECVPEAVVSEADAEAPGASEAVAPEAVVLEAKVGAPVAAAAVAPECVSDPPADMALKAMSPASELCNEKAPVPQGPPDSPDAPSRICSPLAQGFGYKAFAKRAVSRSRSPVVRKDQIAPKPEFVLKKRLSVLERGASQRSSSTSESSQDSSSSSKSKKSRKSMQSCSPSGSSSSDSPPSKTRRLMQSPAPGPRNGLFGSAIAAITPSRNGPASATPRKQMTPSLDPASVERASTRAAELRQQLMKSFSPAPASKAKTPGSEDLKARYQNFLASAPTPTRARAASASGLTPQQDNLLDNFMKASCTPKAVLTPVPAQQTACASPAADLVPQSPGGTVLPRNLTWAMQDAVADETSSAKRKEMVDGKARMLEQLTKQLQVCLARLQDQRLDDANREKYQTLASSVKAQMDKVTDLNKPLKGMKMYDMCSPAASRSRF